MSCHCKPNANSCQLSVATEARGSTPYGEVLPERGIFFRLQVYESVGILQGEVYKRVGKPVIWVCERTQKG